MIVVLTLCTLFHVAFFGIIINIYFFMKLRVWDVDLLNQSNKKLWKKLRSPPKVNFSRNSLCKNVSFVRNTLRKKKEETHFLVLNTFLVFMTVRYFRSFTADLQIKGGYHQNWISGISFYLLFPFLFKFYTVKRMQQTFHRRSWVEEKQYERKEPEESSRQAFLFTNS